MRNAPEAFKLLLESGFRNYSVNIVITFTDSSTLTLTNSEILMGGVVLEDSISEDNIFNVVGSAIINSTTLRIPNKSEYLSYTFDGAVVELQLMVADDVYILDYLGNKLLDADDNYLVTDGESPMILGEYIVDNAAYTYEAITLYLLDNMSKFDKDYSNSTLTYPATLAQIVQGACTDCGVSLATTTFPQSALSIATEPEDCTYRDVISWAAQIAGCYARCNSIGALEIKWIDADTLDDLHDAVEQGTTIDWDTTNAHNITSLYSQDIAIDDTVITGVRVVTTEGSEYIAGTEGYVIELTDNGFITDGSAQTITTWLGNKLIGLKFRRMNITHLTDPMIEAGDIALVTDRKGNKYPTIITSTSFKPYGVQTSKASSESVSANSAAKYEEDVRLYREARGIAVQAKETAEEKSRTFITQPVPPYDIGDIWMQGTNGDVMVCITARTTGQQFNANDWEKKNKYTDDSAVTALDNALNLEGIYNRLTHYGVDEGLFIDDETGRLFINATMIWGGTLKLGGQNNTNGTLEIKDADGDIIGTWNNNGLTVDGGTITGGSLFSDVYIKQESGTQYTKYQYSIADYGFRGHVEYWNGDTLVDSLDNYLRCNGSAFYFTSDLIISGDEIVLQDTDTSSSVSMIADFYGGRIEFMSSDGVYNTYIRETIGDSTRFEIASQGNSNYKSVSWSRLKNYDLDNFATNADRNFTYVVPTLGSNLTTLGDNYCYYDSKIIFIHAYFRTTAAISANDVLLTLPQAAVAKTNINCPAWDYTAGTRKNCVVNTTSAKTVTATAAITSGTVVCVDLALPRG